MSRLEIAAAVAGVLIYLTWIVDAVLYRNWTQLVAYAAQAVGILFLLVFLHHRNGKATREPHRPADR